MASNAKRGFSYICLKKIPDAVCERDMMPSMCLFFFPEAMPISLHRRKGRFLTPAKSRATFLTNRVFLKLFSKLSFSVHVILQIPCRKMHIIGKLQYHISQRKENILMDFSYLGISRECPCGPSLIRFGGKAKEYSPRARIRSWMG